MHKKNKISNTHKKNKARHKNKIKNTNIIIEKYYNYF